MSELLVSDGDFSVVGSTLWNRLPGMFLRLFLFLNSTALYFLSVSISVCTLLFYCSACRSTRLVFFFCVKIGSDLNLERTAVQNSKLHFLMMS